MATRNPYNPLQETHTMDTKGIALPISIDLHKALMELAKAEDRPLAWIIRHALAEHVKTNWETWQDNK